MKKEKNAYITPLLTVVEFRTERGYAASAPEIVTLDGLNAFADYVNSGVGNMAMGAQMGEVGGYFSDVETGLGSGFGGGMGDPGSGLNTPQDAMNGGYFGRSY